MPEIIPQKLQERLAAHGFKLVRQRKHRVYKKPAGQTFVIPSTPSDQRWSANALTDLARLCGPTEADFRPLRARRQHYRLESIVEPRSMEALQPQQPPVELVSTPAPLPALSRADRQRLKRWEKHESQRGAKVERRIAKLRDLAHRAHALLKNRGCRPAAAVALNIEAHNRARQLGFRDLALSVADATSDGHKLGVAFYLRVGGRFVDILGGVLREGPTWIDGNNAIDIRADVRLEDLEQLRGEPMYIGAGYMNPSLEFRLDLKIRDREEVELALFMALLSYEEGMTVLIVLNDGYIMHGSETLKQIAAGGEDKPAKIIYLEGDVGEISRAFNADDCDWPELLEVGRRNLVDGSPRNESYVSWLRHEIAKREAAARDRRAS